MSRGLPGKWPSAGHAHAGLLSPLYGIVDPGASTARSYLTIAGCILAGGGRLLQLRIKDRQAGEVLTAAAELRRLTADAGATFVVNDRVDIALAVKADGVHLGAEDLPLAEARHLTGANMLIGRSTHSLEEALAAVAAGADYIGFGPIFASRTKASARTPQGLERLREICKRVPVPVVAIGGITEATAREVWNAGARSVAMIAELAQAPDVAAKVRRLLATREKL